MTSHLLSILYITAAAALFFISVVVYTVRRGDAGIGIVDRTVANKISCGMRNQNFLIANKM